MSDQPRPEAPAAEPWNDETRRAFNRKEKSEFLDPCQDAAKLSIKCLHRNGGDRTFCGHYFQAYRDCKKAWLEDMKKNRWKKEGGD